jgi:hypothetical protein
MGGVYSLPAMKLTNERDPWLTLLLAGGLGVTVFSMGLLLDATPISLAFVWALGIVLLLLARRAYGSLGHSLERFGLVHAAILVVTLVVAVSVRSHVGE